MPVPGVAMDPRTPQNLMQVPALMALLYPDEKKRQTGKHRLEKVRTREEKNRSRVKWWVGWDSNPRPMP